MGTTFTNLQVRTGNQEFPDYVLPPVMNMSVQLKNGRLYMKHPDTMILRRCRNWAGTCQRPWMCL